MSNSAVMKNIYLTAELHFHTAALDHIPVSVFQDGEFIGCGAIDAITEDAVTIGGFHYVRSACVFATVMFLASEYGVAPANSEFEELSAADIAYVTEEHEGKLAVLHGVNGKRYYPYELVDERGRPSFPAERHAILTHKLLAKR